jgi:serine/threonine-protein kinase
MAQVYLAHDQLLDRPVALKVLFPEYAADRSFVERFRREARAAANLNHPNIVSVYDWGEEGRTYYIVMEYLEGETLREVVLRRGRLPAPEAAEIGAEIASALAFAHSHGVVHRDVKPGNVIISSTGNVKVADFGIARAGDPQEQLTQTGAVMGTATYFSPEQAQGKDLDNRSDLYSLGVVLYEMVAGQPPFTGENPVAIAYQHVREVPPPLNGQRARVPAGYEAMVMRAMAKDPADRYATAAELRADLLRFVNGQPVHAQETMVAVPVGDRTVAATRVAGPVEGTQVIAPTAATMSAERTRRRSGAYIALLVALLAFLGVLLFLLARSLGVGGSTPQVAVPTVQFKNEADATRVLDQAGLKAQRSPQPNDQAPAGIVFDQDPKPGTKVDKGSTVTIKVSQGPAPGTVPDVTGYKVDDARKALERAGFTVSVRNVYDPSPVGEVLDQSPKGGTQSAKGANVRLTVSRGPQPTTTTAVVTLPPSTTQPTVIITEPPLTQPPDTFPPPTRPTRTTRTTFIEP